MTETIKPIKESDAVSQVEAGFSENIVLREMQMDSRIVTRLRAHLGIPRIREGENNANH